MSVAISHNNDQNQVFGLDDENQKPILKGKREKDGKEILHEIVKDTTEAKAKIVEHLTQVMLEMKKAGLGDPLKTLSQNPSWQNFVSTDLFNRKPTTKADDMNMYMEIFKALNVSSQASNIDLAGACRHVLGSNAMTALIEKTSEDDLANMQTKIQEANQQYDDSQKHKSFWDVFMDVVAAVVAVVVTVVALAAVPFTGGTSAAIAIGVGLALAAGAGAGLGLGLGAKSAILNYEDGLGNTANENGAKAAGDLSYATKINQNSISRMQIETQQATSATENFENDKEAIESVKKSVIQAMSHVVLSN